MMNHLTKFFLKAKDEDGNEISQSGLEDGFAGNIYFTEDNYVDCVIKIDEEIVFDNYLDKEQSYMYDAFVVHVQQKMKDSESTNDDLENTNYYLNKTAHY